MTELRHFHLPDALRPIAHAFARVLLPDDLEQLGIAEDVVDEFELSLGSFPPHLRCALVVGMAAFDAAAVLYPPALGRTFTHLDAATAKRWLDLWWTSDFGPVAQFPRGVKALLALAYYEHPIVRTRLAFHPDAWIAKVARRRIERWGDAIAEHERMVLAPRPLTSAGDLASPATDDTTEGASAQHP